jgi:predicted dithiol-disulfide oxidoreductase (DUF899 family)
MGLTFPNESSAYRSARDRLLGQKIALRRQMEALAEARRKLPQGGEVLEDYVLDGLRPNGKPAKIRLSELFCDGTDTLMIYHFMFLRYPTDTRETAKSGESASLSRDESPCPSCTGLLDQLNGAAEHFEAGGANFAVVAKAPLDALLGLARDRGWRHLRLLSSGNNGFKRAYHGEDEEGRQLSMMSVFKRDQDGTIRHFWSSELANASPDPGQDPRHNGTIEPFWNLFDLTPHGRPDFDERLQYDCCAGAKPLTLAAA